MLYLPGSHASYRGLLNSVYFPTKRIKTPNSRVIFMELATARPKVVWLWTKSKEVLTSSVESGWDTFVFTPEAKQLSKDWASLAKFKPLFFEDKKFLNDQGKQIALLGEVTCAEDLRLLKSLSNKADIVVMDAMEWKVINSENLVASFQSIGSSIYAIARSAKEAQVFFESLEKGTDGIILKTEEICEVLELKAYFGSRSNEKMDLSTAIIQRVEQIGTGDRVCVDLCSILRPGEGLLVGSFARGLFLVHSECLETEYVTSRPFRVNAGPVHAYVGLPGGRTSYLSELHTGMQVLVVDESGFQRSVAVGRVKIETRPLMLIEARLENDSSMACSLLLQNAETVSLVCPPTGTDTKYKAAIPVTTLKADDRVLLSLQASARHTGIAVKEFVIEK